MHGTTVKIKFKKIADGSLTVLELSLSACKLQYH